MNSSTSSRFTMPGQGCTVTLPTGNAFYVMLAVLAVGTLGCLALVLFAVIAVAYLLNLALSAICELGTHFATVYSQSDSLTKVIIWLLIVFVLLKLAPWITGSVKRSFRAAAR